MNNTGKNNTNLLLTIIVLLIVALVAVVIYAVNDMRQQRDFAQEKARVMQEQLNRTQANGEALTQSTSSDNIDVQDTPNQQPGAVSLEVKAEEDVQEQSIATSSRLVPLGELPDGTYCYKGTWDSHNFKPQRCRVEFTKHGNTLSRCSYTNENYDVIVPLTGSVSGTTVTLSGTARFEPLIITLPLGSDIYHVVGDGSQGSLDDATVRVDKVDSKSIAGSKIKQVLGNYVGDNGEYLSLQENGDAYIFDAYYTYSISGDKVKLRDSNTTYAFVFNSSSRTLKKGTTTYYRQ